MRIDYMDKPEIADPFHQTRWLRIHFDKPEEVAALNKRDTYKRILAYTRTAMETFLKENADAH